MKSPFAEELPPTLAEAVDAARAVPDDAETRAQQRLAASLAARPRRQARPARGWLAAAATAMAALVIVIGLPLFSGQGDAFAAAQAHFRDFRTLQMDITQHYRGDVLQTSRTLVDAAGVTRTDVGTRLSIIVDPARGRLLTLLHETREAMVAPIPRQSPDAGDELAWLEEIRDFTGQATPLAQTRRIDGQSARGWMLQIRGQSFELWTTPDGLPLELRMSGDAGLRIDYRFVFDGPLPPGALVAEPPPGYTVVAPDRD